MEPLYSTASLRSAACVLGRQKPSRCLPNPPSRRSGNAAVDSVLEEFGHCFCGNQEDMAVAAVHALARVARESNAVSILELFVHLRAAMDLLIDFSRQEDVLQSFSATSNSKRLTTLPLISSCELYQQFAMRHCERRPKITVEELRDVLLTQSAKFAERIRKSKETIAELGKIMFTRDQMVVLTHGSSTCVNNLLYEAWRRHGRRFSLVVTKLEGAQDEAISTDDFAAEMRSLGMPVEIVNAAAVAGWMHKADFVLVGAEAVMENGGIVNRVGTSTLALVAAQRGVPFYVACEACKFNRFHPFDQRDAAKFRFHSGPHSAELLDFTEPSCISLLFTDLGVFTPSSVADELTILHDG